MAVGVRAVIVGELWVDVRVETGARTARGGTYGSWEKQGSGGPELRSGGRKLGPRSRRSGTRKFWPCSRRSGAGSLAGSAKIPHTDIHEDNQVLLANTHMRRRRGRLQGFVVHVRVIRDEEAPHMHVSNKEVGIV